MTKLLVLTLKKHLAYKNGAVINTKKTNSINLMDNEEQSQEELRMENEIKKLKLTLEHGAKFYEKPESNLPLGIEKEFLDYIKHFEQKYEDVKRTTVYEFVGQPAFKKVEESADSELDTEIEKVLLFKRTNCGGCYYL
ncbi:MAG TPA: hypothetical protein PK323_11575 [Bacteroidia bacterium]|nr:hypothetical protein [Bacteroidia bacterium]